MRRAALYLALVPLAACGGGDAPSATDGAATADTTVVSTAVSGATTSSDAPAAPTTGGGVNGDQAMQLIQFGEEPVLSSDGCCVLYLSWSEGFFVLERGSTAPERVSVGPNLQDGAPSSPVAAGALSADGQVVAFVDAADLVAEDTNHLGDVYIHDRRTGETSLVSMTGTGEPAFGGGGAYSVALSGDGSVVAFTTDGALLPEDTNAVTDIYVRDLGSGELSRAPLASGIEGDGSTVLSMSLDGRLVAFGAQASLTSPADDQAMDECMSMGCVYVYDRSSGDVSQLAKDASWPMISGDGKAVVTARARGLDSTTPTEEIVVIDIATGGETVVAQSTQDLFSWGWNGPSAISADGRRVAFWSMVTDLVPDDGNGQTDAFVTDLDTGETTRMSLAPDGSELNREFDMGMATRLALSGDGTVVAFADLLGDGGTIAVAVSGW